MPNRPHFVAILFLIALPLQSFAQQKTGTLTIDLAVRNHQLVVAHAIFDSNGIAFPKETEAKLVQFINESFQKLDAQLRKDSLQECFAAPDSDGLMRSKYEALTQFDTTGIAAALNYVGTNPTFDIAFDFRLLFFDVLENCLWKGSPIIVRSLEFGPPNYKNLSFPLAIKAPIEPDKIKIVWGSNRRKATKILQGLKGSLWFDQVIKDKLEEYYFLLNNELDYDLQDTLIRVLPKKTGRVLVKTDNPDEVDEVFYNILPTRLFKKYLTIPKDSLLVRGGLSTEPQFIFTLYKEGGIPFKDLPVFETDAYQVYQMQLNKLNYSIAIPTDDHNVVGSDLSNLFDVVATQNAPGKPATTSNVGTATPMPNSDGVMGASGQHTNQTQFGHTKVENKPPCKSNMVKRNFLGAGIDYHVEDAVNLNLIYQRLLENGSTLSAKVGYAFNEKGLANGGVFVSANYFKDFIFFEALEKRMSIQLTSNSLYSSNRVIQGDELKERRSTAKVQTELEWFRNIDGHLLLSRLALASQKVTLKDAADAVVTDKTISFAELGFLHNYSKNRAQFATRLMIEPIFKFGLSGVGSAAGADFYFTSKLNLHFNQNLSRGFTFNLDGQTEYDSKLTPYFEQSALQTSQNRGFKEDAVIGRANWNIQPEIWVPLPRFGDRWSKLNQYLYKHIRFAVFYDISYFDKTLGATEEGQGHWYSPGFGIRFLQFPTQINLDLGFGQTPGPFVVKRSQFSINLTVNTPL